MYSAVLQGCVRYGTYRGIPPVYTAGITGTGHFGSFNTTSIPVPNTSVSSAKQNPVPGTSVRSARHSTYSELQIFTFRSDEWIGLLRARNNERVLNRIDSNILPGIFFLIDLKSIRFGGKIRLWVLSGNYLLFSNFYEIGKKQHLTQTPGRQVPRRDQMRATACIVACSPPTASSFFLRRRLGSYYSQLLLSGRRRRKPLNATDETATAMQLSKS